jgi:predicted acylesterase/phospholipase RssA
MVPSRLLRFHPLAAAALLVFGCTHANVQLNDPRRLPENRVRNNSRSAVFADVSPTDNPAAVSLLRSENAVHPPAQSRPAPPDADGYFVGVALSGGGSRSANFTAACVFQLERLGFMKHVDYISSVSGGSLTGAYYCAGGDDEWNPKNVQDRLSGALATDMIFRCLLPWNLLAFTFTDYDRSDVMADVFRRNLFERKGRGLTFADLRPDRPRLLVNATDLQTGRRFVFCNETFDDINSDLSQYPLAYAVAASSAVPVVLHPVTLRDYSTTFAQYRHLIDGGVSDNLGVQTLVETYASQIASARKSGRPDPYPHGAVFVILNAQKRFNARLSSKSDVGIFTSISTSVGLTSLNLVNRANSATLAETIVENAADSETAAEIRKKIRQLEKEGFVELSDRSGHAVRVIYISLAQLDALPDLPFDDFSQVVNHIDTYFNISAAEAYSLYKAADLLVKGKLESNVRDIVKEIESGGPGEVKNEE